MQEKEDLERRNKFEEGGALAPIQIFDRNMDRSTYAMSYTGKNVLAAVDSNGNVLIDTQTGKPMASSSVHDYILVPSADGEGVQWDKASEMYGGTIPDFTYEMASKYSVLDMAGGNVPADVKAAYDKFDKELKENNDLQKLYDEGKLGFAGLYYPVYAYYGLLGAVDSNATTSNKYIMYNGQYYGDLSARDNMVSGGDAKIQRRHVFVQDTWQVNDNTILTLIIRLDNSDLFGSEVTANLGMTHNLNGNPHRRLKANIGTGYTEPGMGELYYNWEMLGSAGGNQYGWYWLGNKNLQPEKSFNMDISLEGENNKTYSRVSLFHKQIDDYMTSYFTGQLINFNQLGGSNLVNADRIYSFKNIGKDEITGIEAEVQQKFNDHWSAKLGYAWLTLSIRVIPICRVNYLIDHSIK